MVLRGTFCSGWEELPPCAALVVLCEPAAAWLRHWGRQFVRRNCWGELLLHQWERSVGGVTYSRYTATTLGKGCWAGG
jgi:hypothetical protein